MKRGILVLTFFIAGVLAFALNNTADDPGWQIEVNGKIYKPEYPGGPIEVPAGMDMLPAPMDAGPAEHSKTNLAITSPDGLVSAGYRDVVLFYKLRNIRQTSFDPTHSGAADIDFAYIVIPQQALDSFPPAPPSQAWSTEAPMTGRDFMPSGQSSYAQSMIGMPAIEAKHINEIMQKAQTRREIEARLFHMAVDRLKTNPAAHKAPEFAHVKGLENLTFIDIYDIKDWLLNHSWDACHELDMGPCDPYSTAIEINCPGVINIPDPPRKHFQDSLWSEIQFELGDFYLKQAETGKAAAITLQDNTAVFHKQAKRTSENVDAWWYNYLVLDDKRILVMEAIE